LLGFTPGARPTVASFDGEGIMVGFVAPVVFGIPKVLCARARPPDRRKIAIVADRRFIVCFLSESFDFISRVDFGDAENIDAGFACAIKMGFINWVQKAKFDFNK
jgi:hypothetical protein